MSEEVLADLSHAFRVFARRPGFAALVVGTLGLGIGATTAIYSVTSAVLFRPLPFPDPDRIVAVYETNLPRFTRFAVAPANFLDWLAQNHVFADLAAIEGASGALSGAGDPAQIVGQRVSPSFFRILGLQPLIGRTLLPEDERPGAPPVVVLSHGLWQRHFGGDREILGRTITLSGQGFTVVGVLPPRARYFTSPFDPQDVEMWRPDPFSADPREERLAKRLQAIGRLAPGVTLDQARRDLEGIAARLQAAYPESNKGWSVGLRPLSEDLTQFARTSLLLLLGAACLLLLIACVNVSNLLLVHATGRRREMAVRASLGASRARVARQLLTETAVLAVLGAGAGALIAYRTTPALVALAPTNLPRLDEASVDARVLGFALAASLLVALVAGLVPALRAGRGDLTATLKEGGDRTSSGRSSQRGRLALVAVQVALGLVLLCGAGLMVGTLLRLNRVALGFDPTNVVEVGVSLPRAIYAAASGKGKHRGTDRFTLWVVKPEQTALVDAVVDRLRALPGVESAAAINYPPASGGGWGLGFQVEGQPPAAPDEQPRASAKAITPGYFRMMRVPLLRGREFTDADREGAPDVVMVNDALARQYLSGTDPLGARLRIGDGVEDTERSFQVVGVVATEKNRGLDAEPEPALFYPYRQQAGAYVDWQIAFRMRVSFLVRTRANPLALADDLRKAVWAVDPSQPIARLQTMDAHIAELLVQRRLYAILLVAFSMLGAGLAALGIYGVTSYAVSQRTHEIGVRMALGALPGQVLRLMLAGALAATAGGVTLGLAGALGLTRLIKSQLYGVTPTDPAVLGAMIALMILVAAGAAVVPARRATRVDPVVTLRAE